MNRLQIFTKIYNTFLRPLKNISILRNYIPTFEHFKTLSENLKTVYEFVLRFSIVLVIISLLIVFLREINSKQYVLKNIDATNLRDSSFIGNNLQQRITLRMQEVLDSTQNAQHLQVNFTNSLFDDAIPSQISGVDINQVFFFIKKFLRIKNYEIRGFLMKDEVFKNKVRILLHIGDEVNVNEVIPKDSVIKFLAGKILMYNSPFMLGQYYVKNYNDKNIGTKIKDLTNYMENLENEEHWYEKKHWNEKRLHIEALYNLNLREFRGASKNYIELKNLNPYNGAVQLEIAKMYNDIIEAANTDKHPLSETTKKILAFASYDLAEKVISNKMLDTDGEVLKDAKTLALMRSQALIIEAESRNYFSDLDVYKLSVADENLLKRYDLELPNEFPKSEVLLDLAFKILGEFHVELTAEQKNLRANIEMEHNHLREAKELVQQAIKSKPNEGNFYDTLAEINFRQGNMVEFYSNLDSALRYPNTQKGITVEGEKEDKRWKKVWKSTDFQNIIAKYVSQK